MAVENIKIKTEQNIFFRLCSGFESTESINCWTNYKRGKLVLARVFPVYGFYGVGTATIMMAAQNAEDATWKRCKTQLFYTSDKFLRYM